MKFEKKIGRKIDSEKRNWFVQNSLVKADLKGNRIGDHSTNVFKEFFENLCEERTISDCEFFLNTRDFPILTQKLTEPYEAIHGDSEELPEYYKNKIKNWKKLHMEKFHLIQLLFPDHCQIKIIHPHRHCIVQ